MKFLTSNGVIRLWRNFLAKLKATFIEYDNTTSKLEATTVQGAIDETATSIQDMRDEVIVTRMGNCYLKYEDGKFYIGYDTEETEV